MHYELSGVLYARCVQGEESRKRREGRGDGKEEDSPREELSDHHTTPS